MAENNVDKLLEPYNLSGLQLKNRVVMAPMTRGRADPTNQKATDIMIEYYALRSDIGLIITEGVEISKSGFGWFNSPGIWNQEQADSWKPVVDKVHNEGGLIFLQIWHTGRAAHSDFFGLQPVAPSAIAIEGQTHIRDGSKVDYEVPRALEVDELPGVVEDFRLAAEFAKGVGFDGVEIHGANGYLLDEFVQSSINKRTDNYGGSLENRLRFPLEVVDAVTTVFPSNRVGYRINPNGGYNSTGAEDNVESFVGLAKELAKRDLAYLHVCDGVGYGAHTFDKLDLETVREVYPGTLIGNTGYTPQSAAKKIESGAADLIAFGQPLIRNPDFIEKVKEGKELLPPDYTTLYSPGLNGYLEFE